MKSHGQNTPRILYSLINVLWILLKQNDPHEHHIPEQIVQETFCPNVKISSSYMHIIERKDCDTGGNIKLLFAHESLGTFHRGGVDRSLCTQRDETDTDWTITVIGACRNQVTISTLIANRLTIFGEYCS